MRLLGQPPLDGPIGGYLVDPSGAMVGFFAGPAGATGPAGPAGPPGDGAEVVDDTTPQLGGDLDLNSHLVGAANAADLTKLHAVTASAVQLNRVDAASSIQTQLDAKQPLDADLTALAALTAPATKLAGIATGATANDTDANLKARANHTGTQSADTITDGTTNKAYTATEKTKLATITGTNTGDQTTVTGNAGTATALATSRNIDGQAFNGTADVTVIAPGTHAATGKTTPVDADELPIVDSAASNVLKKLTWANLKATLKTYFDTLYYIVGGTDVAVADGGTGRSTSTTAYGLLAAGTTATGALQTLAAGATTEILVGAGASALPAWTTATGSGAPVRATSPALVTPALGTPASGTLTNCSFPTLNQSTSGSAATLTTPRNINGVSFNGSADITIIPRVNTTASSATPAINTDTTDLFTITALAAAITSMTSSLTGTPVNGQKLTIRIKDNGTARAITWGASFVSSGVATLLATTVISKTHLIGLIYDSAAAKWVCVAVDATGY